MPKGGIVMPELAETHIKIGLWGKTLIPFWQKSKQSILTGFDEFRRVLRVFDSDACRNLRQP